MVSGEPPAPSLFPGVLSWVRPAGYLPNPATCHMLQEPILWLPHRLGRLWVGTEDHKVFFAQSKITSLDTCVRPQISRGTWTVVLRKYHLTLSCFLLLTNLWPLSAVSPMRLLFLYFAVCHLLLPSDPAHSLHEHPSLLVAALWSRAQDSRDRSPECSTSSPLTRGLQLLSPSREGIDKSLPGVSCPVSRSWSCG